MRQRTIFITANIVLTFLVFSCGQTENKTDDHSQNISLMPRAEQIKITDLKSVLTQLQNRQLEFDFFGIHSNGVDCIYFVPDNNYYAIEFEVMSEEQKPWVDKLQAFAQLNGYRTSMTTYNNQPHYKSAEPAPVLRIETKSNLDQTASVGQNIMTQVFGNNEETAYEVVP